MRSGLYSDQKAEAEEMWQCWMGGMRKTVELGLGYAKNAKPRLQNHNAVLTKLIEHRNAARKARDREKTNGQSSAQEELRVLQRKVRQRLEMVKARDTERRNKEIQNSSSKNPRVYWDMLKRTVGLGKKKMTIPDEVLFDGVVASGDKILEVWREAFRKLYAVSTDDKAFRAEFLEEIKQEINEELRCSHQWDSVNKDLSQPIESQEVQSVISSLKHGKATGVDAMVNKICGEGICQSTARLCNEIFEIPKEVSSSL